MADTADSESQDSDAGGKRGKGGLIIALVGALLAGGGGFYATYSGLLGAPSGGGHGAAKMDFSFVGVDTILVSLGPEAHAETLKFTAELEVEPEAAAEVTGLKPRIVDVLQEYLRAVDEDELEDPARLGLLRAQMLRRIQTVVGDGKVRDLLIMEFILS